MPVKRVELAKVARRRVKAAATEAFQEDGEGCEEEAGGEALGCDGGTELIGFAFGVFGGGGDADRALGDGGEFAIEDLGLPEVEDGAEDDLHDGERNGDEEEHTDEFPQEVFGAADGLGEDRVERAVFEVAREKDGGARDGKHDGEEAHGAEPDVFDELEFLVRAGADDDERRGDDGGTEEEQEVEDLHANELREGGGGDGPDAGK